MVSFWLMIIWVGTNYAYIRISPQIAFRDFYERYRILDLLTLVPEATIIPQTPICAEEGPDCERVSVTEFTMPQNGDSRPTLFAHAPATVIFPPIIVPKEGGILWLSAALDPEAWNWGGDGVTFSVIIESDRKDEIIWTRHLSPVNSWDRGWQEVIISLDDYRGKSIVLKLITSPGPSGDDRGDRAGWGMLWLLKGRLDALHN